MVFNKKSNFLKIFFKNRIVRRIKNYLFRIQIRLPSFNNNKNSNSKVKISILREFFAPPYGGGNQFMFYLLKTLREKGYIVKINSFNSDIDIFIADYCWFPSFFLKKLKTHKFNYKSKLIHRLDGLLVKYRSDGDLKDKFALSVNQIADETIIQSQFTSEQFSKAGFKFKNQNIIYNSADKKIFSKKNRKDFYPSRIKVISASWSSNKKKGMDDYKWLDEHLNKDINYTFIGRLDFKPKNLNLLEPLDQKDLAAKFRNSDIFIFSAINESCPNVLIEAISCGLPIIYKNSGSSKEIVKELGLPYDDVSEVPEKLNFIIKNYSHFRRLLMNHVSIEASSGYEEIIQRLLT